MYFFYILHKKTRCKNQRVDVFLLQWLHNCKLCDICRNSGNTLFIVTHCHTYVHFTATNTYFHFALLVSYCFERSFSPFLNSKTLALMNKSCENPVCELSMCLLSCYLHKCFTNCELIYFRNIHTDKNKQVVKYIFQEEYLRDGFFLS